MRRSSIRLIVLAALLAFVAATTSAAAGHSKESAENRSGVRTGGGVGMYTDPSVANQAATFTINRRLVSCGVGAENIPGIGRFEMLMFSTRIRLYQVAPRRKEITARGEMRSITRAGGSIAEDVRHRFIAHAVDLDGDESEPRRDRFDVHMRTAFWQPSNPLCTPSDRYPGLCRFGGVLILGNVNVAPTGESDGDD